MPEVFFLTITAALAAVGLVLIFDTTSADVLDRSLQVSTYYAVIKQCIYLGVGCFLGYGVYRLGYKELLDLSPVLFAALLCTLVLTLLPGIGSASNGAKRWLGVGLFSFQPSEFAKIILPLLYIYLFRTYKAAPQAFGWKIFIVTVLPLALIFLEPDNGTVLIIASVCFMLFFLTKVRALYWALPTLVCALCGIFFAAKMQHVSDRIQIYLHPELDLLGKGHQPYQAKIAAGSGKLFGKGPGQSLQKLSYLPEANNDYIAAIFAEEYGFLGVCALIFCYVALCFLGFIIAASAPDEEGYYIGSIMSFLIAFQAFLNLGIVSGLLPSTGTTLPFISQGGSSLLSNCIAVSLIASARKEAAS